MSETITIRERLARRFRKRPDSEHDQAFVRLVIVALFLAYLHLSALAGFVLALPMVLYQLWAFVAPGLYSREKRFAVPFVLSWSLINAMATGCVVLGADVPPVREVIAPGRTGLVEPLFDVERLTESALRVLDDPAAFRPLGQAARELVEEQYSLEVAVPALKDYFERVAAAETRRR